MIGATREFKNIFRLNFQGGSFTKHMLYFFKASLTLFIGCLLYDRINLLITIFENFGYEGKEAEMRARVTYYHQVGYYALDVKESIEERIKLAPFYSEILTGSSWMDELDSPKK